MQKGMKINRRSKNEIHINEYLLYKTEILSQDIKIIPRIKMYDGNNAKDGRRVIKLKCPKSLELQVKL